MLGWRLWDRADLLLAPWFLSEQYHGVLFAFYPNGDHNAFKAKFSIFIQDMIYDIWPGEIRALYAVIYLSPSKCQIKAYWGLWPQKGCCQHSLLLLISSHSVGVGRFTLLLTLVTSRSLCHELSSFFPSLSLFSAHFSTWTHNQENQTTSSASSSGIKLADYRGREPCRDFIWPQVVFSHPLLLSLTPCFSSVHDLIYIANVSLTC